MKIIKRHVRTKFIEQTDYPEDKRSKLLLLTAKGESDILVAYEKASHKSISILLTTFNWPTQHVICTSAETVKFYQD